MRLPRGGPRLASLVLIAALLGGAGLLDRRARVRPGRHLATVPADVPMAASAQALSSTWYCAGATATARGGAADGSVVLANAGRRDVTGTVTVFPSQGQPRSVPVNVRPAARAAVRLADVAAAPFASALVELDGGQVVVELVGRGPLGESVTPCVSSPSTRWYFAEGATSRDAAETLSLFNPFPEDAVVDVAFSTEEGRSQPQGLTGLAVVGGSLTAVNVGDFVHRRDHVAAEVRVRSGRLVVGRLQTFDGTAGRKGMSLALGSGSPADRWYFPEGLVTDGLVERFQLFNPSSEEVVVELALSLEQGEAEPLEVTVPGEGTFTVVANEETRIPKAVAHAVTVTTRAGAGVVVERTVDARPPNPRQGVAITPGARVAAREWGLAAGATDGSVEEWLVFQNPGPRPASVSVTALADGERVAVEGLQGLEVGPGRRRAVKVSDPLRRAATPVVVVATQPVVVERDLYRARGTGTAMTAGIPLRL